MMGDNDETRMENITDFHLEGVTGEMYQLTEKFGQTYEEFSIME